MLFYSFQWEEKDWLLSSVSSGCYVGNACLKIVAFQSLVVHNFLQLVVSEAAQPLFCSLPV